MNRILDFIGTIGIATVSMAMAAVPAEVIAADAEGLEACQAIEDNAARLACYDAALSPEPAPTAETTPTEGPAAPAPVDSAPKPAPAADTGKVPPAASPEPVAKPASKPAAEPVVLSDDIGRETVSNVDRDELAVRGKLARCARGSSSKLVFYFENGQVWRQKSSARLAWKECNFEVTIGKDVFGYTMVRDGEKRKVRIERVK